MTTNELLWYQERGYGIVAPECAEQRVQYGVDYLAKYDALKQTPMSDTLCRVRTDLVDRWVGADTMVVDFGCGAGAFIDYRKGPTFGWDINPLVNERLIDQGTFYDWRRAPHRSLILCMWDVLEHLTQEQENDILSRAKMVFATLPVFSSPEHAVGSKHFKPGEHIWYYTPGGFCRKMWEMHGLNCRLHADLEGMYGREDTNTFVLVRD